MSFRIFLIVMFIGFGMNATCQTIQSSGLGSGLWSDPLSWSPNTVPSNANSTSVIIVGGHSIQLDGTVTIDQLTVAGLLSVNAGSLMTIANGSGVDLAITSGSLQVSGTIQGSHGFTHSGLNSSNTNFLDGSIYRHLYTTTEGVLPIASWSANSTVEITGYTQTIYCSANGNWGQDFGNLVLNLTSLSGSSRLELQGNLVEIQNDLTILNTGASLAKVSFTSTQSNTLSIQGSFIVSNTSRILLTQTGSITLNIGEDFIFNSTNTNGSIMAGDGNATLNISGDFSMNAPGGILRFSSGSSVNPIQFNLSGDFSLIAGRIDEYSNGSGNINFTGNGVQNYLNTGSFLNTFNFNVASTSTLSVGVYAIISSTGSFTLSGTLMLGSTDNTGAISSVSNRGNIQVPVASRFFNSGCRIIYSGTSLQHIGSGHPTGSGITTQISNSSGVTMLNDLTIGGELILQSGNLNMGSYSINMNGDIWRANGGGLNSGIGNVVMNGTTQLLGIAQPTFRNLVVNPGASCTFHPSSTRIFGNLTNNGTINASSGILVLSGALNQTISSNGTTFSSVIVNKSGTYTVNLTSQLILSGPLTIQTATTVYSNGNLVLTSTSDKPSNGGSIASLPTGGNVAGDVVVQRYMGAADNYDRFISSPITNASVAQLQDDFYVTGNFTGTSFPCTGCVNNGVSLKFYVESDLGDFSIGYRGIPSTGGTNAQQLSPGVGYSAYMWNATVPLVWDVTGPINKGTINYAVSHIASTPANPSADGWNLVGNPYPSAIQWNNGGGWVKSNIDPVVWVWDVVGRVWRSFNANTNSGDLTNGIISIGQAFWVYVPTAGVATLSVNEAAKSIGGSGSFYRQNSSEKNVVQVSLHHKDYSDNAFLIDYELASSDFDGGIDAIKFEQGIERMQLAFIEKDIKLGYYGVHNEEEIQLNVFGEEEGVYRLKFSGLSNSDKLQQFNLLDKKLNKSMPLTEDAEYEFIYNTKDARRFSLIGKYKETSEEEFDLNGVMAYPNPTSGKFYFHLKKANLQSVTLLNSAGGLQTVRVNETVERGTYEVDLTAQSDGIYLLQVLTDKGCFVKKVFKRN